MLEAVVELAEEFVEQVAGGGGVAVAAAGNAGGLARSWRRP